MHPFSVLTLGIFVAGYTTARWDLVTRLYELAIFAWDHGVVDRAAKGFFVLSIFFFLFLIPIERVATRETTLIEEDSNGIMQPRAGPMRVFWPSDAPRSQLPGVLVGWKNTELEFFVLTILEAVNSRNVELALRAGVLYRNSPHPIGLLFELCRISSLQVLGWSNPVDRPLMTDDNSRFCAYIHPSSPFPRIESPAAMRHTLQIIMYRPPHPTRMQYMSLDPIPLSLGGGGSRLDINEMNGAEEQRERERKMKLVEKLKLHNVHPPPASAMDSPLLQVLDQINCCFEMSRLLQSNVGRIGTRPKRSLSVSERVVESASTLRNYVVENVEEVVTVWIYPVLRQAFVIGLLTHRVIAEVILRILEWRLRPDHAALKDISATAQQVDIRLQQFCYWPFQYLTLRRRRSSWDSVTTSHPDYIRFYNSLWLVANDVIIGIAVGLYVIENAEWVAEQINLVLSTYTVEGLRRIISWLMDWPAGLKLNNELAAFLGDLFLWVIDYWAGMYPLPFGAF
ncbi:MAG: hypothetical protein M1823_001560 [Watsoniomyces obsoletus]|nr:MAG: hypothetical protein M1823_001560 [Watsoniomyces obsoletus]